MKTCASDAGHANHYVQMFSKLKVENHMLPAKNAVIVIVKKQLIAAQ